MRTVIALLLPGMLFGGCAQQDHAVMAERNTINSGNLSLTIQAPTRSLTVGQTFDVAVVVVNKGSSPASFEATSGAPLHIRVMRHTETGFVEVARYPKAEIAVLRPWTLEPGQSRRLRMKLTVEPDWPTGEPLRLAGQVNGLPGAEPGIVVEVRRPQ